MSPTEAYIRQLETLTEGERALLRRLAGQPLDADLPAFDLFTGLWWPLRQASPRAPAREPSWLIAKLHATYRLPLCQERWAELPAILGRAERPLKSREARKSFRDRFDALLQTPLASLEPHLRSALRAVPTTPGLDWAQLLDDLSLWDRGDQHRRAYDIRDHWAEVYLNATQPQGVNHAD